MSEQLRGLGNLLVAARERVLVEKAVKAAKEGMDKQLTVARKEAAEKSYCWTTKDVAREFGVHEKTIARWRRGLGLPSKKFGRKVLFRAGDVRRWAAQRKEG